MFLRCRLQLLLQEKVKQSLRGCFNTVYLQFMYVMKHSPLWHLELFVIKGLYQCALSQKCSEHDIVIRCLVTNKLLPQTCSLFCGKLWYYCL